MLWYVSVEVIDTDKIL